jgi:hypothetical protein
MESCQAQTHACPGPTKPDPFCGIGHQHPISPRSTCLGTLPAKLGRLGPQPANQSLEACESKITRLCYNVIASNGCFMEYNSVLRTLLCLCELRGVSEIEL